MYQLVTIKNFSLTLHKGEIIGLGGFSGCGMHDIGRVAFGLEKIESGELSETALVSIPRLLLFEKASDTSVKIVILKLLFLKVQYMITSYFLHLMNYRTILHQPYKRKKHC